MLLPDNPVCVLTGVHEIDSVGFMLDPTLTVLVTVFVPMTVVPSLK